MHTNGDILVQQGTVAIPVVCITLDLEQDFGHLGHYMSHPSYDALSMTDALIDYFSRMDLPLTCFVQGSMLETHPDLIDKMRQCNIEFEVHTYSHPPPHTIDQAFELRKGWEVYTDFFGKEPLGYRSPSGMIDEKLFTLLSEQGYLYDSSVVPSFRPGVYNGLNKPVSPYYINGSKVIEFPVTVFSRYLRVPISLSYLKLLGSPYRHLIRLKRLSEIVTLSFHLHDLLLLSSIDTVKASFVEKSIFQRMYKTGNGLTVLQEIVSIFKQKGYSFERMDSVYRKLCEGENEGTG